MSVNVTWASDQVEAVIDPTARHALTEVGLPAETPNSLLFEADVRARVVGHDGLGLTRIGMVPGGDDIFVVNQTGAVVAGAPETGDLWHVNETVQKFGECLAKAESMVEAFEGQSGLSELAEAEAQTRLALESIDGSVLRETGGYWDIFLHSVGVGDFA